MNLRPKSLLDWRKRQPWTGNRVESATNGPWCIDPFAGFDTEPPRLGAETSMFCRTKRSSLYFDPVPLFGRRKRPLNIAAYFYYRSSSGMGLDSDTASSKVTSILKFG